MSDRIGALLPLVLGSAWGLIGSVVLISLTLRRAVLEERLHADGGVILLLQPSRSQQKLNRQRYSSGR